MSLQQSHSFLYTEYTSSKDLSSDDQSLLVQAIAASKNAYAPYSNFQVGAAVLLDDGSTVVANNQENIAYPSGMCAERVLLYHVGANYPQRKIVKLLVYGQGDLVEPHTPISPCGACRQVITEFIHKQKSPFEILMTAQNGRTIQVENALDLLPFAFGV